MPLLADRVRETTTTTGTGTYSLAGAATGFRGFVSGVGDGESVYYVVEDGTDWEIGIGTITDDSPDTLSRDSIIASSNSGAAVDWGAGTKNVFIDLPAAAVRPFRLDSQTTPVGNVTTGEDDLMAFDLPGGLVSQDGDGIIICGDGQIGASAGTVTIKFHAGATEITPISASSSNSVPWGLRVKLIRLSASTAAMFVYTNAPVAGLGSNSDVWNDSFSFDWTTTQTLKFTGEDSNGTTDDVQQLFMSVDFKPRVSTQFNFAPTYGFVHLQHQETSGTAGGAATSGSWETRPINAKPTDTNSDCALSSNAFTLQPGTYEIMAWATFFRADDTKVRLQNTTDGTTVAIGGGGGSNSSSGSNTPALLSSRFTISSVKTFELQSQVQTTRSIDGFGASTGFGTEVYANILLRKVYHQPAPTSVATGYVLLQHQETSGTGGGTATTGSWETRPVTTEVTDTNGDCSAPSSNQWTLQAGTYEVDISATYHRTDQSQVRLFNVSDSTVQLLGTISLAFQDHGSCTSEIRGRFTIASAKTFRLESRVASTFATNGFGIPGSWGTEVYANLVFRRVA